ncbi:winged helix-turn-helix domain-containing protein [Streptacidiphilus sp. PAMC 29251]
MKALPQRRVTAAPLPQATLLVVDEEPTLRELLSAALRFAGFRVCSAATGAEAAQAVVREHPDLVLLDLVLSDMDGFTFLRRLRLRPDPVLWSSSPRGAGAEDRLSALRAGCDDYLTKPFNLEELVARIRAILRRTAALAPDRLTVADLELDPVGHQALRAGRPVDLSPTEFKLLDYLMSNSGRVVTKKQILDHVWSYDFDGDLTIVESYISYLRRKVDSGADGSPRLIHTLRGIGYVLRPPTL